MATVPRSRPTAWGRPDLTEPAPSAASCRRLRESLLARSEGVRLRTSVNVMLADHVRRCATCAPVAAEAAFLRTCVRIAPWLAEHGAGTLSPAASTAVAEHLRSCRLCRTEAAALGIPQPPAAVRAPASAPPPARPAMRAPASAPPPARPAMRAPASAPPPARPAMPATASAPRPTRPAPAAPVTAAPEAGIAGPLRLAGRRTLMASLVLVGVLGGGVGLLHSPHTVGAPQPPSTGQRAPAVSVSTSTGATPTAGRPQPAAPIATAASAGGTRPPGTPAAAPTAAPGAPVATTSATAPPQARPTPGRTPAPSPSPSPTPTPAPIIPPLPTPPF